MAKLLSISLIKKIFTTIKNHKKLSLFILFIVILITIVLWPKNKVEIATQKVTYKDLQQTVSITGKIEAENKANLTFQSLETLSAIYVKLGDIVKKGQVIACIDEQKLQASFRQAQQDFTAAKAASQQYYDDHNNDTESNSEKVQRTAIDAAQNKAYDQILKVQHDLNNSCLYSPLEGVMTRIDADTPGVNVNSTTVFTVTDPNSLNFAMDVDEADIGKISQGEIVDLNLDTYPNENIKLHVNSIDFVTHTTSTGGNAYTVKADLKIDNSEFKYRVGMSGNAEIIVKEAKNVLVIPLSSFLDDKTVYVKRNGKYIKTTVAPGLQSDTESEIKNGLSENDEIVLDPTQVK